MEYKINDVFPVKFEPGTYISYEDKNFYAVIADEFWSDLELKIFRKGKGVLQLVHQNDVCILLVTINDVIETSDFYFEPHEEDSFELSNEYHFNLLLLDKDSVIRQMKKFTLTNEFTDSLNQVLKHQLSINYNENDYNKRIDTIQNQYEPFELEEFVIAQQVIKK